MGWPWIIYLGVVAVASITTLLFAEKRKQRITMVRSHAIEQDMDRVRRKLRETERELAELKQKQKKSKSNRGASTIESDYKSAVDNWDCNLSCESAPTASLESILRDIDQILNSDTTTLMRLYENLDRLDTLCFNNPTNPQILYRIGQCQFKLFESQHDTSAVEHLNRGIESCRLALRCQPELAEAHKWLAILLGVATSNNHLSTADRIQNGRLIKNHIESAVRLDPKDCTLRHMFGRYSFEIAELGWYERKWSGLMGSYDEALGHFLKADDLSKVAWQLNRLYIAKCRISLGNVGLGVEVLRDAVGIVPGPDHNTSEDKKASLEVRELLNKYS